MKEQFNKMMSGVAGFGLFLVGCVMAGLGLSVVFFLAMFALAVVGLAFLASPLVALAQRVEPSQTEDAHV